MNLLSGYIKIGGKRKPLLWTGEIAQHVHDNYMSDAAHDMLHMELQQTMRKCIYIKSAGAGKKYFGLKVISSNMAFQCVVVLFPNFAKILTGYKIPIQNLNAAKQKAIAGNSKKARVQKTELQFSDAHKNELSHAGVTVDQAQKAWSLFLKTRKKK